LLEGLEITELNLSEVRRENLKLRLDSGYFAKPMLEAEARIRKLPSGYDELGPLFSRFVKALFANHVANLTGYPPRIRECKAGTSLVMSTSNARESPHSRAKGRTPTRFAKRAKTKVPRRPRG
jgi:hypothetical protein